MSSRDRVAAFGPDGASGFIYRSELGRNACFLRAPLEILMTFGHSPEPPGFGFATACRLSGTHLQAKFQRQPAAGRPGRAGSAIARGGPANVRPCQSSPTAGFG